MNEQLVIANSARYCSGEQSNLLYFIIEKANSKKSFVTTFESAFLIIDSDKLVGRGLMKQKELIERNSLFFEAPLISKSSRISTLWETTASFERTVFSHSEQPTYFRILGKCFRLTFCLSLINRLFN